MKLLLFAWSKNLQKRNLSLCNFQILLTLKFDTSPIWKWLVHHTYLAYRVFWSLCSSLYRYIIVAQRVPNLAKKECQPWRFGFRRKKSTLILSPEKFSYQITGSTIRTLLHGKINPKDWQVLSLGDVGFLQYLRVVSGDYGKPWMRRFDSKIQWDDSIPKIRLITKILNPVPKFN